MTTNVNDRKSPTAEHIASVLVDDGVITADRNGGRFDLACQRAARLLALPLAVWQQKDDDGEWYWIAVRCDAGEVLDLAPADPAYATRLFRMALP